MSPQAQQQYQFFLLAQYRIFLFHNLILLRYLYQISSSLKTVGENLESSCRSQKGTKYNSQELDKESDLYFFNARFYDPEIARFTTADTVIDGNNAYASWNRFAYVQGNPIKYRDPTGNDATSKVVDAAQTVSKGAGAYADQTWEEAKQEDNIYIKAYKYADAVTNYAISAFTDVDREDVELAALTFGTSQAVNTGARTYKKGKRAYKAWRKARRKAARIKLRKKKVNHKNAKVQPKITKPYKRPSGATTAKQRKAQRGKKCITCGKKSEKMVADHKWPLVKEFYETGKNNLKKMKELNAVQPQCATCSAKQGGHLKKYSMEQKKKHGL